MNKYGTKTEREPLIGRLQTVNNQAVNINIHPLHSTKIYMGNNEQGIMTGFICTTDEHESLMIEKNYVYLPLMMISDLQSTNATWERERNNLIERDNDTTSSTSVSQVSTIVIAPTISAKKIPTIFKGSKVSINEKTAESVINLYEKGLDDVPAGYTWTSLERQSAWSKSLLDQSIIKNNNANYINLCKDYIYCCNNSITTGEFSIDKSRINMKNVATVALDIFNNKSYQILNDN
jgi:hypothetical protein